MKQALAGGGLDEAMVQQQIMAEAATILGLPPEVFWPSVGTPIALAIISGYFGMKIARARRARREERERCDDERASRRE